MAVEQILLRYFMGSVQIKASAKPIVEFPTENVIYSPATDNYIEEKKSPYPYGNLSFLHILIIL